MKMTMGHWNGTLLLVPNNDRSFCWWLMIAPYLNKRRRATPSPENGTAV